MLRTAGRRLSDDEQRWLRSRSQGLTVPCASSPLEAVARVVGVQAQDSSAARLGIRARSERIDANTLDNAISVSRSIIRTWAMRGTLHMLAAADVHWVVELVGHRFINKYRRARLAVGLTDALLERAVDALPAVLRASAPVTRSELVDRLRNVGVAMNGKGQAPAHLVVVASLQGILCCGPDTDSGKSTHVLLDEWAPRQNGKPADPLGELARRYLLGHGPASVSDFAAWSGLPTAEARDAIVRVADDFEEAVIEGEPAWFEVPTGSGAHVVRLLGGFDAYLLAYRQRTFALDPLHSARVHPGGGMIRPVVLVDGHVEGTWHSRSGRIDVEWFGQERNGFEQEVDDVARFLLRN
jgi:DNA glycosylase AlkZ-like